MAQKAQDQGSSGNTKDSPKTKRNRHRNYCFTFNNYTEDNIDFLTHYFENFCNGYCFQEEKVETPHLQGVIKFKNPKEFSSLKKELPKEIHWEPCRSLKASIDYCSDYKKRHGRIWHKNMKIKYQPKDPLKGKTLYPWQKNVLDMITKKCEDDRKVYWFWEGTGNTGKTTLAKHICIHYNAIYVTGKSRDIKFAIAETLEKNPPDIIIYDFTRSQEEFISYQSIEEVKNGIFFSGKYEGKMIIYDSPWVICFANYPPEEHKMSSDRWSILKLYD